MEIFWYKYNKNDGNIRIVNFMSGSTPAYKVEPNKTYRISFGTIRVVITI